MEAGWTSRGLDHRGFADAALANRGQHRLGEPTRRNIDQNGGETPTAHEEVPAVGQEWRTAGVGGLRYLPAVQSPLPGTFI
jgi:hypothetical protein